MVKIKRILFALNVIFLILAINAVYAANVGIIVEFGDGSVKTDCVNVAENTDGYDILQKSIFDILWAAPYIDIGGLFGIPGTSFGQAICKINNEGTDVQGSGCFPWDESWNFNILPYGDNAWIHSPVGHNGDGGCWNGDEFSFTGKYCGIDKDLIGYDFGSFPAEPPLLAYEQVCEKLFEMIKVKDIQVYVDGKKESGADEDGGKIDAVPGSEIELKIEIENLYADDEDVDVNGILVQGILESIDDGSDIEDEADDFDLRAERNKEVSLKFDVPLEVDEGDYDLAIEIEGKNERGFPYFKKIDFEVNVEKERHDVIFGKLNFLENSIQCGKSASLEIKAANLGTEDESVRLAISNSELGINIQESFELNEDPFDKGSSFSKTYKISVPSDAHGGVYTIPAGLFFADEVESSTVELNVECEEKALELEENSAASGSIEKKLPANIAVTKIAVSDAQAKEIEIAALKDKPVKKEAASKVYQYLQITEKSIKNTQDGKATIGFKVPKAWLNENSLQSADISLYRFNNNQWAELGAKATSSDGTYVYYEADTPGLSYFAIGSKTAKEAVQTTVTNIAGAAVSNPAVKEKGLSKSSILMASVVAGEAIILIAGIGLLAYLLSRKH